MAQDKPKDEQPKGDGQAATPKAKQNNADPVAQETAQPLSEDQASLNPVGQQGVQGNYDPTGQIVQPGEPLHSTDPEKQAAFEQERQEAIRRSQMGETLPAKTEAEERENS
jgi:hypothetical protein